MILDQLYLWAFDADDPFTPEHKHFSRDFLVAEIAEDLSRKVYKNEVFVASDLLDNLYITLIQNNIKIDDFLALIYRSQHVDCDKYLFTMYGMSSWIFEEHAGLCAKNPLYLKTLGIKRIPLNLDPEEIKISTDFFTLLNINALKNQILESNLNQTQKTGLINFFNCVKKKAQFEYGIFDAKLAKSFSAKEGLKKLYENLINSTNLQIFSEIVSESVAIIASENKLQNEDQSVSETKELVSAPQSTPKKETTTGVTFKNIKKIGSLIVGQRNAVARITQCLKSSAIGLKKPNRPIGAFLFDGPTGIGKTEMAKAIALSCFEGRIHVEDMTEYKHESDLSRLTGASAGFVGYNDTPAIINFLTNNKSGVILFDEIDKCSPKCLDILMRMIDEGEFQTAKGEMLSTKEMVIVCTTNMSEYVEHKTVGFNVERAKDGQHSVELATSGAIRPEILARFDDVIKFEKLSKEECSKIALNYLLSQAARFNVNNKDNNILLLPTPEFIEDIIEECNYKVFGARNVCLVASKHFNATIVNYYEQHNEEVCDKVLVVFGKDKIKEYSTEEFEALKTKELIDTPEKLK